MGSVTGVLYFDFGEELLFPSIGWSDFVIVIVNWWLVALEQLLQGCKQVELRFMDGPYWITVIAQENAELLLRCHEDSRGGGVYEVIVDTEDLRRELTNLAEKVSRACAEAGIESSDLDDLRMHLPN